MNPATERARKAVEYARASVLLKLAVTGCLLLLLLIPLSMIRRVVSDRRRLQGEAVAEIASKWGRAQTVVGPLLIVPYQYVVRVEPKHENRRAGENEPLRVEELRKGSLFLLPEQCRVKGRLAPERRYRGIFGTVVYAADLEVEGRFGVPDTTGFDADFQGLQWDQAVLALSVGDLRGTRDLISVAIGGERIPMLPGKGNVLPGETVEARLSGAVPQPRPFVFRFACELNGSSGIRLAPVGTTNVVELASAWPDPSFQGTFLPVERSVSANGFEARWETSVYGRACPGQWTVSGGGAGNTIHELAGRTFGVDLIAPVDAYRNVERAFKYALLFIVFVFTAFFLFEVLLGLRVHPLQYALVGMALCLFFLGLLALSEVLPFGIAYLAAAVVSSLMVCGYSASVLHGGRRALVIALELAAVFAYLYITLQLQDYALLTGSAGLFGALGLVMYLTRNIDWYATKSGGGGEPAPRASDR